jgi:hypothetical protein
MGPSDAHSEPNDQCADTSQARYAVHAGAVAEDWQPPNKLIVTVEGMATGLLMLLVTIHYGHAGPYRVHGSVRFEAVLDLLSKTFTPLSPPLSPSRA